MISNTKIQSRWDVIHRHWSLCVAVYFSFDVFWRIFFWLQPRACIKTCPLQWMIIRISFCEELISLLYSIWINEWKRFNGLHVEIRSKKYTKTVIKIQTHPRILGVYLHKFYAVFFILLIYLLTDNLCQIDSKRMFTMDENWKLNVSLVCALKVQNTLKECVHNNWHGARNVREIVIESKLIWKEVMDK